MPRKPRPTEPADALELFERPVQDWFRAVFEQPTRPQSLGWHSIAKGDSTLILAPTGTGKTLAAFLWCLNRLMFTPTPTGQSRCRVLYVSPIKALAVDVERNLRAPLVGISQAAKRAGIAVHEPAIAIRTGDTSAAERSRFARHPSDILITTPESLYLLLTSNARDTLRSIETVIVDEIHALVPTKRGSHFALSLERLELLCEKPPQRIGLSATQRPLEEVARFLGGATATAPSKKREPATESTPAEVLSEFESDTDVPRYRPVTIVDASEPKQLVLRIESPMEDMTRLDEIDQLPSGPASQGPVRPSIWSAIYPKLLELVKAHRSTLIFVNSRRLAERVSGAINDLAEEVLVRAHHGSVAAAQRKEIEERLKLGTLRGLVATSSLELGIDMGAIDMVVQIEAPPSVSSGMQRVGRSSHHVGGVSSAIIFPKYRGDLIACAAITKAMYEGKVESVHYPRNPLDVLAQQIVAMVAMESWDVNELYAAIRRSAPYAALTRGVFDSVLDMLAGRYPSDEFVELKPRITWDRVGNRLTTRQGARLISVVNAGTIPDRGLYGVFLAGAEKGGRVGELDEEMIFESRLGDTVILGATTWRIEEITHNRVLVSPAPGEPGKMPFWRGDSAARPAEFGRHIGQMVRELLTLPRPVAFTKLIEDHSLDQNAAENLLRYLEDQALATERVPNDQDILIEHCRDELGDWRVCVLTPFGSAVHAPWCMATTAKVRAELGLETEAMWNDDGFVLRLPESDQPLDSAMVTLPAAELKDLVLRELGRTSLFAAKFREAAARALLLPRRRAGQRSPLWQQRKRAADLLSVASRYPSFPILLEAYRECLRDTLDLKSTAQILTDVARGKVRTKVVVSEKPSPFASTLLFSYIANYIYDGDAPLAERRAQALAIDQSQLEEILGSTDFRELLDAGVLDEVEARLQATDPEYRAKSADGLHDLLLKLGDLTAEEITARCVSPAIASSIRELVAARRALPAQIAGERRYIPVEYAARYRDALGVPLPPGLADVFLKPAENAASDLVRRYARTHGPFTTRDVSLRFAMPEADVENILKALHAAGTLYEGEFRPSGIHREWCDPEVLQQVRRRTLSQLRREVVPAEQRAFAQLLGRWQGVLTPRRGLETLLDAIEILQGASLLVSDLERDLLPARVADYKSENLDALLSSGEVLWIGEEPVGDRDGRVSLYLADSLPRLLGPPPAESKPLSERAAKILEVLRQRGATFFSELHRAIGGTYPGDTQTAIWELVWARQITNDTFHPLRQLLRPRPASARGSISRGDMQDVAPGSAEFLRRMRARSGHLAPEGRWSLVEQRRGTAPSGAEWAAAVAQQLLIRYGIVMRETANAENLPGGYSTIYPVLKTMEESGWVRRGMFVAAMGAAQFATTAAVDMLRSLKKNSGKSDVVHLAAADPANPYGALLPWPKDAGTDTPHGMARAAGASVILVDGELTAFLRRGNPAIRVFLPQDEPERSHVSRSAARKLAEVAVRWQSRRHGLLITTINDQPAPEHFLGSFLEGAGFVAGALGFQMRRVMAAPSADAAEASPDDAEDEAVPESA